MQPIGLCTSGLLIVNTDIADEALGEAIYRRIASRPIPAPSTIRATEFAAGTDPTKNQAATFRQHAPIATYVKPRGRICLTRGSTPGR